MEHEAREQVETRLDKIEDQLDQMALVLEHLTTNVAYMAAKRNVKLLNISGYPRTEE
jgi:dihydroorotase